MSSLFSGCVWQAQLRNPVEIVRGAHCPSGRFVSLGEVVAGQEVVVSHDLWGCPGDRGCFASALEEAGVKVLSSRPYGEKKAPYLDLGVWTNWNNYGRTLRVRMEVRNSASRLLYFNEQVTSSRRTLAWSLADMSGKLCQVESLARP